MQYYIIAGEPSGDLHGSHLIAALKQADPDAKVRCWGGDKMEAAGGTLVMHYRHLAYMGFVEVIKHLPKILRNISLCKADIQATKPDVLVLIDYPGFNMRIAAWAKQQGYRIAYYISPQVWAWKENRVVKLKRDIDKMLVILPFEVDFYKKHGYTVQYVGHPLVAIIDSALQQPAVPLPFSKPVIALLPGSRKQEIAHKLPVMLHIAAQYSDYQFVVAAAPSLPASFYEPYLAGTPAVLWHEGTYPLLKHAKAALVTSGTATLETALFGVPMVVAYKGNPLSFWLAKKLVKVKYVCLVNLILDQPLVQELLQDNLNPTTLNQALNELLHNEASVTAIKNGYARLRTLLGAQPASRLAAEAIVALGKG